ncbi:protein ITPRID2 isoform X1 [Kryptolebias marmoratus]|uniref:protein ITPRID2 isoform X1 n=1 Tax=Kryptolebias marmoratus TaxID=37003 RepID=UPI0018ACBB5D|nr:protein ITPRID2 isoform X1 [Kryptolebias marmoratus]
MESGLLEMKTSTARNPNGKPVSVANVRRQAWARSRESLFQGSKPECGDPPGPQQNQSDGDAGRQSENPGQNPVIESWLIDCSSSNGTSVDDPSASPGRGALKNGCSFDDDLSLGAEANHLQSTNNNTEPCFSLVADQKRNQYKERGRSMNSTGSGKSSNVSSVSELLDLCEEDPVEVLINLGFGREEPDMSAKIPPRFFNSTSSARGIDIKVYLGAQLQRMELENPNYALTSRFRQIEVLTTVANEFFQLYSQVSGQPVQRISTKDSGGGEDAGGAGGGGGGEDQTPSLKRSNSALNVAKILKKSISKHNLLSSASESPEAQSPNQKVQLNGHAATPTSAPSTPTAAAAAAPDHAHAGPEQDKESTDSDNQVATISQKVIRKKDHFPLATVTEETSGGVETDQLTDSCPSSSEPEPQLESADLQSASQRKEGEGPQVAKDETNITSTPEKAASILPASKLAQFRTENADSFDMEEVRGLPGLSGVTRADIYCQQRATFFPHRWHKDATDTFQPDQLTLTCMLFFPLALTVVGRRGLQNYPASQIDANQGRMIHLRHTPEMKCYVVCSLGQQTERRKGMDEFDFPLTCSLLLVVQIHTNEDEAPLSKTFRTADWSRTVSQQSDSSGFAEETSVDSSNYLKIQESSDSCDSETTVTSHPSQDVPTPHALDQPAFDLPDGREEEPDGTDRSSKEVAREDSSEQFPLYTTHYLAERRPAGEDERVENEDRTDPDTERSSSQNVSEQEPQPELEYTQNEPVLEPQHTETADTETPTEGTGEKTHVDSSPLDDSASPNPPVPLSPFLCALNRAKRHQLYRMHQHSSIQCDNMTQTPVGGKRLGKRGAIPMQRSSSLPSSLLSPSRVVSSVKIQFRKGHPSSTQPKYSFKYAQEAGEDTAVLEENQSNCQSTLIINPGSKDKTPAAPPHKPIPPYLLRSSCSVHSTSPPPDWSLGGHAHSWSTQSIPDLSSSHRHHHHHHLQPSPFQLSMSANQSQQSFSPGQMMFPTHSPSAVFSDPSPYPSPVPNSSTYPFSLYPYVSPPFHHNPSLNHYSSLSSLHQPLAPLVPPHGSLTNLHQTPGSAAPHPFGLGHLHPGTPPMHHQGYNHPHELSYPLTPHGSQFASPYHGTLGYNVNPQLHHLAFSPSAAPGSGAGRCPSSTEMQLRRVLHEIRATVQSLGQSRVNTPDMFSELRAAAASQQSVAEFQEKRRSLNIFRSQMMDLELSIMQQQAMVYKHLSPAERIEAEQLQALRSAVREELQELEQQLEDRLLDLTPHTSLRSYTCVDNVSTSSALRAMEPMSDLLREQFFLQTELVYDGHDSHGHDNHGSPTNPSTRSPSPVRGKEGDGKQTQVVYKASINITPTVPPRPGTHIEEEEEKEEQRDSEGVEGREEAAPETEGAAGRIQGENLQQLIREIRESVAQEVRREIYSELLAAASSQGTPLSARQRPL